MMSNTPETHRCYQRSQTAFEQANRFLPGGVNSPVRAYQAVGCDPISIASGSGATVTDLDSNVYVDYVCSYGPLILGHAQGRVIEAVTAAAAAGTSFGMPTEYETRLARLVVDAVPSIEVVRFVNSGTEATMSAIRLARAATGRDMIIKCVGCYHGHSDGLLVQAGSGATTLGVPSSPGVPGQITALTLLVPFNDLQAVEQVMAEHGEQIACMIMEPIAGNMGCIAPRHGYLQGLRKLCDQHGALLIFDEVMTGFRVHTGGAQTLYDVRPDLTSLGKVIGGGLPCAAYGGSAELMHQLSPRGPVYQAGTLSGNPLAMAAGIATLEQLADGTIIAALEIQSAKLVAGLVAAAAKSAVPVSCTRVGSMLCCFFVPAQGDTVDNYAAATACDTEAFAVFFRAMLDQGVVLPPSQFETWFVSAAHDTAAIDQTIEAAAVAFSAVASFRNRAKSGVPSPESRVAQTDRSQTPDSAPPTRDSGLRTRDSS
jgi:glutamate-1-semialdehyde 2,1-aminomutase